MLDPRWVRPRWVRRRLILALAGGALFWTGPAAPAQTEIRVALGVKPGHALVTHGWSAYAAAATAESGGTIKFRMMIGSQHVALHDTLASLRDASTDATFLPTPIWPGEFPHQRLIGDLALLGTDAVAMTGAISEFVLRHCPDCLREMTAQHVVYTGGLSSGMLLVLAHERLVQPHAFHMKKIRSPGRPWNRWLATLSALPIGLDGEDLRGALRSGALDATIASISEARERQLWGVTGHATLQPLGTLHAGAPAAFALDFWRRLPATERKILFANASLASLGTAMHFYDQDRDALRQATGQGFILNQPDARLIAAHDEFIKGDLALIEREATAYGIRNAKVKIELLARLAKKWTSLAEQADYNAAQLAEQMRREIYTRIDAAKYGS